MLHMKTKKPKVIFQIHKYPIFYFGMIINGMLESGE